MVIENVPFMLQLGGGSAIRAILAEFERLGYRWAYRVVDTFSFGLPQRRERVFLVASRCLDPAAVLLVDEKVLRRPETDVGRLAHGFYWTEGLTGLGWAVDCVPTLKSGSAIGIPSPPAVLLPDRRIVRPGIGDAERLQGFDAGWTLPAEGVAKRSVRWSLIGNAVSVPVAQWIGERLLKPGLYNRERDAIFPAAGMAPRAARYDGRSRHAVDIGTDPLGQRPTALAKFLSREVEPLSLKAAAGFLSRTRRAKLRFDDDFILAVERHVAELGGKVPPRSTSKAASKLAR